MGLCLSSDSVVVDVADEVDGEENEPLVVARKLQNEGKYHESLLEFVKYYAILQEQGKEKDDLATADFYDEYGWAFTYQGQHDRALEYYEKALAIRLDTLGAEHPEVTSSYYTLGCAYDSQGD